MVDYTMITSNENGHTVLTADNNMKLFNGSTICNSVILGANDNADNWQEVPFAKAQKLERILSVTDSPEINSLLAEILDMPNEEQEEESEEDT